ncbi:MAG: (Fe-S)-binding protein, partial [Dehalococcoidales bacterium]|nr:(Fe-S)-binding protein [Dehalococcoidales bacterium]
DIAEAAILFHVAGENWMVPSEGWEETSLAMFAGDGAACKMQVESVYGAMDRLKPKRMVVTECGHAYRVMSHFYETWAGEKHLFKVRSILEVIAEYIREGKIKLAPGHVSKPLTYHEPCQVGRNAGFYEEPRYIVRQVASDFRELTPNRERNWCCGGGGGLVAEFEFDDLRIKTGERKVQQIRETGAEIVVSPCENCRLQLDTLNEKYNMEIEIISMMDLVVDAMVIDKAAN